ncbi:MAG TPA: hypothetical protein VL361_00860 [Candidatus Limnocylindrales bacterium]|nr:hypothetical protein [Candidatus Limnocylindrales bacterium]
MQMKLVARRNAVITLALIGMSALSPLTRKAVLGLALAFTSPAPGQNSIDPPGRVGRPSSDSDFPPPSFDGRPPFGPGGRGGFALMRETKLVARFDKDGKGCFNTAERKAAREYLYREGYQRLRHGARSTLGTSAVGPRGR